jgi:hypothetical protein
VQIFIFNYFFRNYNKSRLNITTCIFSNWVGSSQFSIWRFFSRGGVLDVRDYDRYEEFSKKVKEIVKEDGLNILFNNAGVSSKFTRIQLVKSEQMLEAFKVNTIGPIMLTKVQLYKFQTVYFVIFSIFYQALLPLLKQAANNNSEGPLGAQKAVVINTTSVLGSIALNNDGGFFPYRCSKVREKFTGRVPVTLILLQGRSEYGNKVTERGFAQRPNSGDLHPSRLGQNGHGRVQRSPGCRHECYWYY